MMDHDETNNNNSGKTARKSKTKNPLSYARGKQQRPENVWFRRSGAGIALFVEYYAGQPIGTVCSSGSVVSEDEKSNNGLKRPVSAMLNQSKSSSNKMSGMSRASQKRNKKRKKSGPAIIINETPPALVTGVPFVATASKEEEEEDTPLTSPILQNVLQSSPLLDALQRLRSQTTTSPPQATIFLGGMQSFLQAMSRPLPLTFRLRQHYNSNTTVVPPPGFLEQLSSKDGDFRQWVAKVKFDSNIYQALAGTNLSKESLAKLSPSLKEFLFVHSQDGTLARQELGSMLPVLALQKLGLLKLGCRLVDVCASPGSKTLQALEIVGPKGRVVANDVLENRLTTLQEAVGRSGVPTNLTSRITYSCQDATKLELPRTVRKNSTSTSILKWNVVLVDVPCSGDGTCRKDKHILPMWKPNYGNDLHSTQLSILVRALELVDVGGIVCYSTCSLNPVEDEAVVAAAIQKMGSKKQQRFELVEFPDLPGFVRRPGIQEWRVADYTDAAAAAGAVVGAASKYEKEDTVNDDDMPRLQWYDTWQEAINSKTMKSPLKSMWPSSSRTTAARTTVDLGEELHLERCTRLWPQDQDTGGFFLALIRKNA
jgi:16S rRNA C967 or C1407 C5-methylase (RsmB/RsmF family)